MHALALFLAMVGCTGTAVPSASPPLAEPIVTPPPPVSPATDDRYAASQVLIAWTGCVGAPATLARTEDEARTLAEAIRDRALAGEDFAALARDHSDSPGGRRGGNVGVYLPGTMMPAFEEAVAAVEIGAITPVVRTPYGFHVIRRDAVVEARVSHVLVAFQGAERAQQPRSRDEALARITDALRRIDAGEPFEAVAAELSDDPSAPLGGDIGLVAPGQMVPAFEDALFALKPGEHSGVVETPYGFHVILRRP